MERNAKFVCECGAKTVWRHRNQHYSTKKHQKYELKKKREEDVANMPEEPKEQKEHDKQLILNKKKLSPLIIKCHIWHLSRMLEESVKEFRDAPSIQNYKNYIDIYLSIRDLDRELHSPR